MNNNKDAFNWIHFWESFLVRYDAWLNILRKTSTVQLEDKNLREYRVPDTEFHLQTGYRVH